MSFPFASTPLRAALCAAALSTAPWPAIAAPGDADAPASTASEPAAADTAAGTSSGDRPSPDTVRLAQHQHQHHDAGTKPGAIPVPASGTPQGGTSHAPHGDPAGHAGRDHGAIPAGSGTTAGHAAMPTTAALGPYPAARQASGTGWQPDLTPMEGVHAMRGRWSLMGHGFVNVVRDRQTGPRGDTMTFAQSMAMLMAQRPVGDGATLGLRAMVSLDPTMGRRGYPLLFQTGETADGRTHLVDRQHPHDAFMELSASLAAPLGATGATGYVYLGLPGEPALGPPTFMHRYSGMRNPEAPLTHHWLDSTHITFGVATLGVSKGAWKAEASWFNGREPDQHRWNIETRAFDSWSARLSFNPTPAWSMQVSHGDLKSPEQLSPEMRVRRWTASATWHARPARAEWATTFAWGRNDKSGGSHGAVRRPAWLLESTVVAGRHTVFGRWERVRNDELFGEGEPLHGRAFAVQKLALGYVLDVARVGPAALGLGVSAAAYRFPSVLEPAYGSSPRSMMVFVQGRL